MITEKDKNVQSVAQGYSFFMESFRQKKLFYGIVKHLYFKSVIVSFLRGLLNTVLYLCRISCHPFSSEGPLPLHRLLSALRRWGVPWLFWGGALGLSWSSQSLRASGNAISLTFFPANRECSLNIDIHVPKLMFMECTYNLINMCYLLS